jgi:hypothetical protein
MFWGRVLWGKRERAVGTQANTYYVGDVLPVRRLLRWATTLCWQLMAACQCGLVLQKKWLQRYSHSLCQELVEQSIDLSTASLECRGVVGRG